MSQQELEKILYALICTFGEKYANTLFRKLVKHIN